jgi:hypothetical protein
VADGVVTADVHQTVGSVVESVKANPGGEQPLGNFGFTFKSAAATIDLTIAALHSAGLLDLWASVLSHHSGLATDAQGMADIKGKMLATLPVFDSLKETGTINDVGVETAVGTFALKQVGAQINFTGLVPAGHLGFGMRGAGLAVPENLLSPWQKSLVPTDFDITANLDGVDFDAGARAVIAAIDLTKKPVIDHDAGAGITAAFLHNGPIKITVPPSHIVSSTLQLEFKGDVTITQPIPHAHVDVSAKGLDATMDMLKSATRTNPSDPLAASALAMLDMAAKLGKPGSEGAVVWAIDFGSDGAVVINGTPIVK